MRLTAAIEGNLAEFLQGERTRMALLVTAAVNKAGDGLKEELRRQVRANFRPARGAAKLGQNLANTWRARHYPSNKLSLHPASLVYTSFRHMAVFETGATIRAASGNRWLAIPTPEAEKRGFARAPEARDLSGKFEAGNLARRAQPGAAGRALGGLRFIPLGGDLATFALDVAQARGLGIRVAKRRRVATGKLVARRFVPIFWLVRQVTLRKRLDVAGAAERWLDAMYRMISTG